MRSLRRKQWSRPPEKTHKRPGAERIRAPLPALTARQRNRQPGRLQWKSPAAKQQKRKIPKGIFLFWCLVGDSNPGHPA